MVSDGDLEDTHISFTLLRACFGACRINYQLRTTRTIFTGEAAIIFDNAIIEKLRQLCGGISQAVTASELLLSICITNDEQPHFGIGIASASDAAPAAHLASVLATDTTVTVFWVESGAWLHNTLTPMPHNYPFKPNQPQSGTETEYH